MNKQGELSECRVSKEEKREPHQVEGVDFEVPRYLALPC